MKKTIIIIALFFLSYTSFSQDSSNLVSSPGLYNAFQWTPQINSNTTITPQLWFYNHSQKWYFESRYNYEYNNTASFYGGRVFNKVWDASDSMQNIWMAGVTAGDTSAISFAHNISIDYMRLHLESENEFVMPFKYPNQLFFYNWTKCTFEVDIPKVTIGGSWQIKLLYNPIVYVGPMIRISLCKCLSIDGFGYYDCINKQPIGSIAIDFENK